MKKVHSYVSICVFAACAGNQASAEVYLSESFDNQTVPFGNPETGHHISTTGSNSLSQFTLVSTPAISGKSVQVDRLSGQSAPVLALYTKDNMMLAGKTVEFSTDFYNTDTVANSPVQIQLGMTNGGAGRMLFFGVGDKINPSPPNNIGRIFYTDAFANAVFTDFTVAKDTWYNLRTVWTLQPDPAFPTYMTGTFDLFVKKQGDAEVQLANDVQLGYALPPTDSNTTPDWNESTAAIFRISKGPSSGATFYDNVSVRDWTAGLLGDANLDGKVNTADFNVMAFYFGQSGQTSATGDFSGNGTVGSEDLNILIAQWGKTTGSPSPGLGSVVPEPVGIACVMPAMFLLRRARGR